MTKRHDRKVEAEQSIKRATMLTSLLSRVGKNFVAFFPYD